MTIRSFALLSCAVVLIPLTSACDDGEDTIPTSGLSGSWEATSFVAQQGNLLDQGMGMDVELTNSSTYNLTITGDRAGLCNPGPDCTRTGNFSADQQTITLDPGPDGLTFTWVRTGETMTWTGTVGGVPATITFDED